MGEIFKAVDQAEKGYYLPLTRNLQAVGDENILQFIDSVTPWPEQDIGGESAVQILHTNKKKVTLSTSGTNVHSFASLQLPMQRRITSSISPQHWHASRSCLDNNPL